MYNDFENDDELMDYIEDFEVALSDVLDRIPEFQNLIKFLDDNHRNISLYIGAQIMGAKKPSRKKARKGLIKNTPLKFEFNSQDKKFLKALRIEF